MFSDGQEGATGGWSEKVCTRRKKLQGAQQRKNGDTRWGKPVTESAKKAESSQVRARRQKRQRIVRCGRKRKVGSDLGAMSVRT